MGNYYIYRDPDDELLHYGRKGMKWGQHIFGKVKSGARIAARATASAAKSVKAVADEHKRVKHAKEAEKRARKRAKIINSRKLTDEELRERIERLELEQSYQKLVKSTSSVSKGREIVGSILESAGKNIATQAAAYLMGRGVNFAGNKIFGEDIVNPKKGQKDK